jgi:sugar O-acyltransferase (sialic acid O-acetyltransferase NeuD family)
MRIIIFGGGGHGKVVADLVRACGHDVTGFVDVVEARIGQVAEPGGARILYMEDEFMETLDETRDFDGIALALGENANRLRAYYELAGQVPLPPLIHPSATVSPSASIGDGTVVMPGVVINADADVGQAVILNSACVVEHDCRIDDAAHVSPGAILAGETVVETRAWVGSGATVIPKCTVGTDAVVGAGATVIHDVAPSTTVVGTPARVLTTSA